MAEEVRGYGQTEARRRNVSPIRWRQQITQRLQLQGDDLAGSSFDAVAFSVMKAAGRFSTDEQMEGWL